MSKEEMREEKETPSGRDVNLDIRLNNHRNFYLIVRPTKNIFTPIFTAKARFRATK